MEVSVITLVLSLVYNWEHISGSGSIMCRSLGFGRHRGNQGCCLSGPKDCSVQQYLHNHSPRAGLCAQNPDINKIWLCSSRVPSLCVKCSGAATYRSMTVGKGRREWVSILLCFMLICTPISSLWVHARVSIAHMAPMPTWPEMRFYSFIFEYNRTECHFYSYYTRQNK